MPEGDTLHRIARTLKTAIVGKTVTSFHTVLPGLARVDDETPLRGRTIEDAAARGKHLLIYFSGDLILRSHLRMNGSWHIYRPGERWQRPRSDMRVAIGTEDWVVVGFNVPVAEFLTSRTLTRQRELRRMGPDLIGGEVDFAEVRSRARNYDHVAVAEVLLNQSVAGGIGNVYKSELLFLERINPCLTVASLTDAQLDALFRRAKKLMDHNATRESAGRETRIGVTPDQRLWVYGRRGQPCRTCGTPIVMKKQGRDARVTYWCPRCQP